MRRPDLQDPEISDTINVHPRSPLTDNNLQVVRKVVYKEGQKHDQGDGVQQTTQSGESPTAPTVYRIPTFQHGCEKGCQKGDKERRQIDLVQHIETLPVGHRHHLHTHGKRQEDGSSDDGQHAVEAMRTEHQEGDPCLPCDNGNLPVATAAVSVAAVEESHRLVDPVVCVVQVLFRRAQDDDEGDQQSTVDEADERQDQNRQHQVIAFEALQTRLHGPVARLFRLAFRVQDVMGTDAEDSAERCLDHGDGGDVPEDHDGQERSLG